ncbi:interleukin-12 receptor subunit beta-1 [Pezoporus occidentalis]|uniref:interleukin-12 receptor subunit beta-1 n=1 Tax=Pezoporus occidentalis TaxID=407982 RepID=UPI002F912C43
MLGWLLVALVAGGTTAVPGLSCWKRCGFRWFLCSWPPLGPAGNTSYVLTLCYTMPRRCQRFQAGTKTTHTLKHHHVYVLTNTTAWVEAHWGDHIHRTPNRTLYFNEAVKPDPPSTGMPFTKTSNRLRLRVPRPLCHSGSRPPQREARFRRVGAHSWTQVMCETGTDEDDSVTCILGGDGAFEVQLRHKLPHWSSYWSDWSSSIFVPAEILESPVLSYQLGNLGRDGQRVLRLSWQRAPEEQGDVTYTVRAHMLACRCARLPEEDAVVLGRDVTRHNLTLSGAEYEILLTAANAAGPGPARQLCVPAEQRPDLGFKDVSVTGGTMTARWEAPSPGSFYCFEQQPLPGAPKPGICIKRDFPAKSIHVERGALEVQTCHRLAVHGWAPARGWATFALQHHYASNTSLAVPIRINTSAEDAAITLRWSPSPRATCPGVLAKYLICHAAEGDNVTYGEADVTASHYTLRHLQPGTAYRVSVQEVTAESKGTCGVWWHFQTKALGPQRAAWKSNLKYLGISLSVPAVAAIYQLNKKRARRLLFPPLPKPAGSKAIQFCTSETSQGQPWPGFVEPSERFSPAELLLIELNPSKEGPDGSTEPSKPQPGPVAEEPVVVCPLGCEKELPFAYRRQEVLSPAGFPAPGSTSYTGHPSEEEEEKEEEGSGELG